MCALKGFEPLKCDVVVDEGWDAGAFGASPHVTPLKTFVCGVTSIEHGNETPMKHPLFHDVFNFGLHTESHIDASN